MKILTKSLLALFILLLSVVLINIQVPEIEEIQEKEISINL